MGVVKGISHDTFPRQSDSLGFDAVGSRVKVCFNYDTHPDRVIGGEFVRSDAESPGLTIIRLDDGRYVLTSECQWSPDSNAPRKGSHVEDMLTRLAPITNEPDWVPIERLSEVNRDHVINARRIISEAIAASPNPGLTMRGITMALADAFEPDDLVRGAAFTMRGVRNAFAERAKGE